MSVSFKVEQKNLDAVMALLAGLEGVTFEEAAPAESEQMVEEPEEPEELEEQVEVSRVMNHRWVDGRLQYLLSFVDGEKVWVDDAMCDCEWLISKYNKSKKIKTAYVFCRVSTKRQADENCLSLDGQESYVTERLPSCYTRVKVLKISKSVYKKIPRELVDIGQNALPGDGIFVYRVDRLTRNIENMIFWLKELDERGVTIQSVLDSSAMVDNVQGIHMLDYRTQRLTFLSHILEAEKESAILSKKAKDTICHRIQRGDECLGNPKFGMKFHRENGGRLTLQEDVEAVEAINIIMNEYRNVFTSPSPGKILKLVAAKLNKKNLKYRGGMWKAASVKRILHLKGNLR